MTTTTPDTSDDGAKCVRCGVTPHALPPERHEHWTFHWRTPYSAVVAAESCDECADKVEQWRDDNRRLIVPTPWRDRTAAPAVTA